MYIEYEMVNGTRYVPRTGTPRMFGCNNATECSWYVLFTHSSFHPTWLHLHSKVGPATPSATIPKDTLVMYMNGSGDAGVVDGEALGGLDFGCTIDIEYEDPITKARLPGSQSTCNFHIVMPDTSSVNNTWRPMCMGYGSFTATLEDDCVDNECVLVDHIMYIPSE